MRSTGTERLTGVRKIYFRHSIPQNACMATSMCVCATGVCVCVSVSVRVESRVCAHSTQTQCVMYRVEL
jgi:hypothetical protein